MDCNFHGAWNLLLTWHCFLPIWSCQESYGSLHSWRSWQWHRERAQCIDLLLLISQWQPSSNFMRCIDVKVVGLWWSARTGIMSLEWKIVWNRDVWSIPLMFHFINPLQTLELASLAIITNCFPGWILPAWCDRHSWTLRFEHAWLPNWIWGKI